MDDETKYYMVYRVYSNKERPGIKDKIVAYGWTTNKNVLKAFFKQRNDKKYMVRKVRKDQIGEAFDRNNHDATGEYMIEYLPLRSAKTNESIHLFMTTNEMQEVEIKIQRMFEELSSLDRLDKNNIGKYANLVLNIDQSYYDALFYIGYRPKEIAAAFESMDISVCNQISNAYDGMPCEEYYYNGHLNQAPGLSALEDVSNKIIYSIESFIKVMRKDL